MSGTKKMLSLKRTIMSVTKVTHAYKKNTYNYGETLVKKLE